MQLARSVPLVVPALECNHRDSHPLDAYVGSNYCVPRIYARVG